MEKTFTKLGSLKLGDFEYGLIVAVGAAICTVLYQAFDKGLALDWVVIYPVLKEAIRNGILGGLGYLLKNLFTGVNGKLFTNAPPSPLPEKK